MGLIDLSTIETCTCLSLEVKDCIEFGIFGTNKIRLSEKPFFFLLKKLLYGRTSLPADVLLGSFVTHSFLPHGQTFA